MLTAYMARTGIGDAELARRIGVSRLTLVRWKLGVTSRPRHREDVARCAELLRLTPYERNEFLLAAGFSSEDAVEPVVPQPLEPPEPAAYGVPEPSDDAVGAERRPRGKVLWAAVAAAALLLVVLGGVAVIGLLGRGAYPAAADGESLIVTAPFVNYTGGQQEFNVHGRLRDQIEREVLAAGLSDVRTAEWPEEIAAEEAAVAVGLRSGAKIVIWGEYDSGRVVASFTIPRSRSEPYDQQVVDLSTSPSELPATINVGLAEEVRYAALLTLGQLYLDQESYHAAKLVLLRAMAEPPLDPDTLTSIRFRLGRAYQGGDAADLDEAITLFTQVLAVRPNSVDTYNSRALAYLGRGGAGDVDRALADLTKAADTKPRDAATYLNRAVAYMESGRGEDLDRAIADLTRAMTLRIDYAAAHVNRAGAYLQRNGPGDLDLVSCIQSTLAKAGHAGQDFVSGLGPYEGLGVFVGNVQVAVDGSLQFGAALMHAPAQLLFGEQTEPALHQVQPGGAGGREMNMEAGPLGEPVPDQRRLVGGVVVGNQVHVQLGGHLGLDGIEKLAELQGPVAAVALANHLTGPGVQSSEEGRGAVAHVIMGAPLGLARTQGQKRPGAVQGLDLGLLVHAQDQRPVRRVEVEPHNIPHLLDEEGVRRQLEGLGAVGLQRERHARCGSRCCGSDRNAGPWTGCSSV